MAAKTYTFQDTGGTHDVLLTEEASTLNMTDALAESFATWLSDNGVMTVARIYVQEPPSQIYP